MLCDFLNIFEEATREIEATKRPTLHLVVPWFFRIKLHCQPSSADNVLISQIKIVATEYLTSNIANHISDYHKVATFLCPTLKPLRMYSSSSEKNEIIDTTRDMLSRLVPDELDLESNRSRVQSTTHTATTNKSLALLMFEGETDDFGGDETDEVQNYINEHVIRMDGCLLEWYVPISLTELSLSTEYIQKCKSIPIQVVLAQKQISETLSTCVLSAVDSSQFGFGRTCILDCRIYSQKSAQS